VGYIKAPERVLKLNESAVEILQLVNGEYFIKYITNKLIKKNYKAPREQVLKDVIKLLQKLVDRRFVIK
jgi:coenzyme PQQ biosynthesis protein PqqD